MAAPQDTSAYLALALLLHACLDNTSLRRDRLPAWRAQLGTLAHPPQQTTRRSLAHRGSTVPKARLQAAAPVAPAAPSTAAPPWRARRSASLALLASTAPSDPSTLLGIVTLDSSVWRAALCPRLLERRVRRAHLAPWGLRCPTHAPLASTARAMTAPSPATAMQGSTVSSHPSPRLLPASSIRSSVPLLATSAPRGTTALQVASTRCHAQLDASSRVCARLQARHVTCAQAASTALATPQPRPPCCALTGTSAVVAQAPPHRLCAQEATSALLEPATQHPCLALPGSSRTSLGSPHARPALLARTAHWQRWSLQSVLWGTTAQPIHPVPPTSRAQWAASATSCLSLPRLSVNCAQLASSAQWPGKPPQPAPALLGTTVCAVLTKLPPQRASQLGTRAP